MNPSTGRADLREMLEIERTCCRELHAVLERERDAASAQDLLALLETNKEREATQARWERIAGQRSAWLERAGATLDDLARADPALQEIRHDLSTRAEALQRMQRVNHGLVRAVLGQVSGLIHTIRRELPGSRYDRGADITAPLPSSRSARWSA